MSPLRVLLGLAAALALIAAVFLAFVPIPGTVSCGSALRPVDDDFGGLVCGDALIRYRLLAGCVLAAAIAFAVAAKLVRRSSTR